MVRRSMRGCESYSSARAGARKCRCADYALSRAIVCPVKAVGFDVIFIPRFLNSSMAAKIGLEPHPRGMNVQNIPHGPVYFARFAGYITLANNWSLCGY